MLLVPLTIHMPRELYDAAIKDLDCFERAGFAAEDFGEGCLRVREVPTILEDIPAGCLLTELCERLLHRGGMDEEAIYDELYHSVACKAAIKGNIPSMEREQQELLRLLQEDPTVRNCPMGGRWPLSLPGGSWKECSGGSFDPFCVEGGECRAAETEYADRSGGAHGLRQNSAGHPNRESGGCGEIVSADSMQIYRGVDIATAKAHPEELAAVPHHLIGFCRWIGLFRWRITRSWPARKSNDILSRGKVPVLCGGTGLYIKAIVDNVQYSKAQSPAMKRCGRLRRLAEREGNDALWRRLEAMDPETAKRIHPNNVGRVIRAIEVMTVSGKSIREHEAESLREPCPYHVIELGLRYHDRETLYGRINRRVDKMVEMGLTEEVKAARKRGLTATAAQAIGCKELYSWLDGKETREEALEKLKQSTRRYAKRRLTWFGTDQRMRWIEPDTLAAETPLDKAMEILERREWHEKRNGQAADPYYGGILLVFAGLPCLPALFQRLYYRECIPLYGVPPALPLRGCFFGRKKLDRPRAATCAMRCVMAKRCGWAARACGYRYSDALSADLAERQAEGPGGADHAAAGTGPTAKQQYPYRKRLDPEYGYRPAKAGGSGGTGALQRDGYPGAEPAGGDQPGQRHYRENRGAGSALLSWRAQTSGSASGEAVYSTLEELF